MKGWIWWTYDGDSQESDVIGVKFSVVKEEGQVYSCLMVKDNIEVVVRVLCLERA